MTSKTEGRPKMAGERDIVERINAEVSNEYFDRDKLYMLAKEAARVITALRSREDYVLVPEEDDALIRAIIDAWDSVSGEELEPWQVRQWLSRGMKPSIDKARAMLAARPRKEEETA